MTIKRSSPFKWHTEITEFKGEMYYCLKANSNDNADYQEKGKKGNKRKKKNKTPNPKIKQ